MSLFFWYNISIVIGALLAIISYYFLRWKNEKFHLLVAVLVTYISVIEITGRYLTILNIPNTLIYNLGFVFAEVLLILFLFHIIFHNKHYSKLLFISACFFVLYFTFNALLLQPFILFQSYSYMVGSLLIIGFSLAYFYEEVQKSNQVQDNLLLNPEFWTVSLIGLFFSTTVFIFAAVNTMSEHMPGELINQLALLIQVSGAIMYLGIGAALLICSYILSRSRKMA